MPKLVLKKSPYACVPAELKQLPNWVVWKWGKARNDGKRAKLPINPHTGTAARVNDSSTWGTFEEADAEGYEGKGFMFSGEYVGIDFDDCRNPATGVIEPGVMKVIEGLNSYTEISPSGKGVHVIVKATLPGKGKRRNGIEIYHQGRYFTVTGRVVGKYSRLRECQAEVDDLYAYLSDTASAPAPRPQVVVVDEPSNGNGHASNNGHHTTNPVDEMVAVLRADPKYGPVFDGDDGNYPSPSEADQGLCSRIARLHGRRDDTAEFVEAVFNKSKRAERKVDGQEKWKRADYRESTIAKAMQGLDYPLTDSGNAERLFDRHGESFRYVPRLKKFVVFNGKQWQDDDSGIVDQMALEMVRDMKLQAAGFSGDEYKRWARHAHQSEQNNGIRNMLDRAKRTPKICMTPDQFNADRWALNSPNGTIDLRTGKLRPHRREDFITHIIPVEYDPDAKCPLWKKVLDTTTAGNKSMQRYFQQLIGMFLTGDISEQNLFIFHGEGGNGKSVILDTIAGMLGEYAHEAPEGFLTAQRFEPHPTDIADLRGRRLCIASETEKGAALRIQRVKRLTGNLRLKGRYMHQDFFEFDRTHKLILVTNNKPNIGENTNAVWRRVRLVPFNVVIAKEKQDKNLLEKLRAEWPGILAWAVRGCLDWQKNGLVEPEQVVKATEQYAAEQDVVGRFIADRCTVGASHSVGATTLYEQFGMWCVQSGEQRTSQKDFGGELTNKGYTDDGPREPGTGRTVRYGLSVNGVKRVKK
jgi:putative DNA primase/helicase